MLKVGYARVDVTPPLGTFLTIWLKGLNVFVGCGAKV